MRMGSKPSKSSTSAVLSEPENSQPGPDGGAIKAGLAEVKSSVPVDERTTHLLKQIKISMQSLQQAETYDEEVIDPLNDILKIYYLTTRAAPGVIEAVGDLLIEEGILQFFVQIWDNCHENPDEFYSDVESVRFANLNRIKIIFWNYSDKCKNIATACYEQGAVIERIMREFSLPQLDVPTLTQPRLRYMIKADLGILHNLLRYANQNRNRIRMNNGIEKLLAYEKSSYLIVKAKVFIVLAYCINEDENSKIMAGIGVIGFILKILDSAISASNHVAKTYSFSAEETVAALNKLASNDENKKAIVEAGILPMLTKLLTVESSTAAEQLETVNCIWSLAFHPENKEKVIQEPGLIDAVKSLRNMDGISPTMTKVIQGAMFELGLDRPVESHDEGGLKHIMLSYNWEVQSVMLKLRDYLRSQDISIWMDVDKIHDSILSAMADAVENSSLIIVAMTESYKNSNSCRTEAEYAYKRAVPILPLLLQEGYRADGWLGAMVGTKLYVNLTSTNFELKFPDILHEVHSLTAATGNKATKEIVPIKPQPARALSVEPLMSGVTTIDGGGYALARAKLACQSWSVDEVKNWCARIGIGGLQGCDGAVVSQLCKLLLRSPDMFYRILREDLHYNFKDMLLITNSIEGLLG